MIVTSALHLRLAAAVAAAGLTQRELAKQLGVVQSAVSHWLTGRRVPDVETVQRIAAIVKVDAGGLLLGAPLSPTTKRARTGGHRAAKRRAA